MMARPTGKPRDMADIYKAVGMYIDGKKMSIIAETFNVSQPTISYWVKEHGKALFGTKFKSRSQGRRQEETPNDRDKNIVLQVLLGVPCVKVGSQQSPKISRARISYIVKTWLGRGYKPETPFKPGDVVSFGNVADYLVLEVHEDYKSGRVRQIVEWDEDKKESRRVKDGRTIEDFRWYAGGELCNIINDTAAS